MSWRTKLTPSQDSRPIGLPETAPSALHARIYDLLDSVSPLVQVGIPGEDQLKTMLAKRARKSLAEFDESQLRHVLELSDTALSAIYTGGADWEQFKLLFNQLKDRKPNTEDSDVPRD